MLKKILEKLFLENTLKSKDWENIDDSMINSCLDCVEDEIKIRFYRIVFENRKWKNNLYNINTTYYIS